MPRNKVKASKRTKEESSPGYSSEQPDKCLIMESNKTTPTQTAANEQTTSPPTQQTLVSMSQPNYAGCYYPPHLQYALPYTPQPMGQPHMQTTSPQRADLPEVSPSGIDKEMFTSLMDKLASIEKAQSQIQTKLSKLDSVESNVKSMMSKLTKMESRIDSLEVQCKSTDAKIIDLEASRNFDSQLCDELKQENISLKQQVSANEKQTKILEQDLRKQQTINHDMSESIVDLQSRSMRENLLFHGFEECKTSEDWKSEDCSAQILDFCCNKLGIEDAKTRIKLDRAHRVGKYDRAKTRPIVAKFNFFGDKVEIKNASRSKLSNEPQRVGDQFPQAIRERRQKLIPYFVEAKSAGKPAVLSYDKLYMDNKTYTADNLPSWTAPPMHGRNNATRQNNT